MTSEWSQRFKVQTKPAPNSASSNVPKSNIVPQPAPKSKQVLATEVAQGRFSSLTYAEFSFKVLHKRPIWLEEKVLLGKPGAAYYVAVKNYDTIGDSFMAHLERMLKGLNAVRKELSGRHLLYKYVRASFPELAAGNADSYIQASRLPNTRNVPTEAIYYRLVTVLTRLEAYAHKQGEEELAYLIRNSKEVR